MSIYSPFQEINLSNTKGFRPFLPGEYYPLKGEGSGVTNNFFTVPADKIYLMTSWVYCMWSAYSGDNLFWTTDSVGADSQYFVKRKNNHNIYTDGYRLSYAYPLPYPAGYMFNMLGPSGGAAVVCVQGWLCDT